MKKKRFLWVIKVGSQLIVDGGPLLIRSWMQDVATLLGSYQIDIIWVSSGAIASAKKRVKKSWKTLPEKQALSAIGQPMLLEQYSIALAEQGLMASQVLLSYRDFKFASSKLNLKNTLKTLLNWQVIPILNENDAVATDEIQFGDNDFLSALVACEMKADRLVILTNVEGLYSANPNEDQNAYLIESIDKITSKHLNLVKFSSKSDAGRGGMSSKLKAAKYAQKYGVPTQIVKGDTAQILVQMAKGNKRGTCIGKL